MNVKYKYILKLTRKTFYLGTTTARLKLKGIGGDIYKRWNMWFNPIQRVKPYQSLTIRILFKFLNNFNKFILLNLLNNSNSGVAWSS